MARRYMDYLRGVVLQDSAALASARPASAALPGALGRGAASKRASKAAAKRAAQDREDERATRMLEVRKIIV